MANFVINEHCYILAIYCYIVVFYFNLCLIFDLFSHSPLSTPTQDIQYLSRCQSNFHLLFVHICKSRDFKVDIPEFSDYNFCENVMPGSMFAL